MSRSTKILVFTSIFVVAIFGASIFVTRKPGLKKGSIAINVVVAPEDSNFTVDGKTTRPGKISLTAGKHKLSASHQYFETVNQTVDTKTFDTSQTIYLSPLPNSDQAKQWLADHPTAQQEREAAGSSKSIQAQNELTTKSPLVRVLPYEGFDFSIDYGASKAHPEDPNKLAIYITRIDDIGKTHALNWITAMGYNPADYEIIFNDIEGQ